MHTVLHTYDNCMIIRTYVAQAFASFVKLLVCLCIDPRDLWSSQQCPETTSRYIDDYQDCWFPSIINHWCVCGSPHIQRHSTASRLSGRKEAPLSIFSPPTSGISVTTSRDDQQVPGIHAPAYLRRRPDETQPSTT